MLPRFIELETSRYCNRQCEWCPNSNSSTRKTQEMMDWSIFTRLINELSSLRYSGNLALHSYNEPLANPRLFGELDYINQNLPTCSPRIFSNGDYVTPIVLDRLLELGVTCLSVSLYPHVEEQWSKETSIAKIHSWLDNRKVTSYGDWKMVDVRQGIAAMTSKGRLTLEIIAPNVQLYNYRGGSVASISGTDRQDPCYMTHHSAAIDYRGLLKMCCNIYPDYAAHAPYVIGSLSEHSFLELWLSNTMQNLRAAHLKADWQNSSVCSKCTTYLPKVKVESLELVTE
jgi:hypothetical protein